MSGGQLDSRVAVITGAGSGIGRSVVERFVAEGARVVIVDRSASRVREAELALGDAAVGVCGDVRDSATHQQSVRAGIDRFGGVDILVANAGVFDGSVQLSEMDDQTLTAAFDEVFAVNVLGYLLAARAAVAELRRRGGCIVFTVSNAGLHAGAGGGTLYTTAKHAVVGLVRQLAFELAPEIRVNGVAPGGTVTDLRVAQSLAGLAGRELHFDDAAAAERAIRESNPLRIAARPEDHAGAFLLLAGTQAAAVTGEILSSDGGLSVRGLALERESDREG